MLKRLFRVRPIASLALVAGLAASLPAVADGLGRFDQLVKAQIPPDVLKYKNAKALGDNGFVLEDVVVTPPPDTPGGKAEPVAIKRIAVEDIDFASIEKKAPPNFARIRVEGIAISGKPTEGVDLSQMAGIDKLAADFQLDYKFEPERQTFTLNRLELDLNGLARAELTMILDGVSADLAAQPDKAMDKTSLRTASFVFEDRSLLGRIVPAAAKLQGSDPDKLLAMAKPMTEGVRAGQGPATQAVFDALLSFAEDYKQPKGPLRLTLNPPGKVSATLFNDAKSADDVVKALGLVVSYAGTRVTAASTGGAATGAAKPTCTPGSRFFVFDDDAWQSATARQPAKSGNGCVVRIDGGGTDDVTVPLDKALAWNIDGPGKAVEKCRAGDKVVVEHDGGWHPAKVTDKPFADGQCPVKFEIDDDEEKVELKRVRRLD